MSAQPSYSTMREIASEEHLQALFSLSAAMQYVAATIFLSGTAGIYCDEYHKSRKRRESMITTGQAYRHGAPVHDCPVPHTKMAAVSAVAQRKERT